MLATVARRTVRYGPCTGQEADLHLPAAPRPPVVALLHGGFWRMPHGRDQLRAVAEDLVARGYAVWNIGYRRLGAPGGGWPGTLEDAATAIDHLATLAARGESIHPDRVVVAGHSAGGQLALWLASRRRQEDPAAPRVLPLAVAALAPLADLKAAADADAGDGAVCALLGGSPDRFPERYAAASPIERLPFGVPQLLVHGTQDTVVPVEWSHAYVAQARARGDQAELAELPRAGHMDFLDPASEAHGALCAWLARVAPTEAR